MPVRFCGRCGTQRISEGDLYCLTCGRPYTPPTSSPSTTEATFAQRTSEQQPTADVSAVPSQELKTRWLDFWTYVHLPLGVLLGVPLALSRAGSAENLLGIIIAEIPIIWLVTATVFGLHKRKLSAWQLNWLCLLGDVIGFSFTRVGKAATGEKAVTFATSLLIYSLIWRVPNYIYFKKRRVLFSGPPLVEGGLLGVFNAVGRFFWPSVASLESATRASREGFYATTIVALLTLILVSFSVLGYPLFGFNPWSLLDASIFAVLAWGIYRLSRVASTLSIVFFIVEQVYSWTTLASSSFPGFIGRALTTSVLSLMFVNGARGTFAYQRHQKVAAGRLLESASTSSLRWKIYSAVLTSFVMGVFALRVYQSLTNVTQVGNEEAT